MKIVDYYHDMTFANTHKYTTLVILDIHKKERKVLRHLFGKGRGVREEEREEHQETLYVS
jgi:hypothetical protein